MWDNRMGFAVTYNCSAHFPSNYLFYSEKDEERRWTAYTAIDIKVFIDHCPWVVHKRRPRILRIASCKQNSADVCWFLCLPSIQTISRVETSDGNFSLRHSLIPTGPKNPRFTIRQRSSTTERLNVLKFWASFTRFKLLRFLFVRKDLRGGESSTKRDYEMNRSERRK